MDTTCTNERPFLNRYCTINDGISSTAVSFPMDGRTDLMLRSHVSTEYCAAPVARLTNSRKSSSLSLLIPFGVLAAILSIGLKLFVVVWSTTLRTRQDDVRRRSRAHGYRSRQRSAMIRDVLSEMFAGLNEAQHEPVRHVLPMTPGNPGPDYC
ncbi:hypothetical protein P171DRAFT_43334 [Karstenula rhodostoma CBS 690.94]|uniref:Uncharacterized protein n=1 Tax=Karstenula rhodostoma CBS 690.94 TaxID=1392251 RepID=A0A9P4UBX4_9PLEO|nr:hypothetical protein P171DRAFT_43334 [Karstenula rhodostoma CBS 690.94]